MRLPVLSGRGPAQFVVESHESQAHAAGIRELPHIRTGWLSVEVDGRIHELGADDFLAASSIDEEVLTLRPDYRTMLLVAGGLAPRPPQAPALASSMTSCSGPRHMREMLTEIAVTELSHIAAWREAYRAFGTKPQRTRNSLEALTRRAARVNALTDVYNAISVLHQIPFGGEDFHRYQGPAQLTRAAIFILDALAPISDHDVFKLFRAVTEHTRLPVIVYDNPGTRTSGSASDSTNASDSSPAGHRPRFLGCP